MIYFSTQLKYSKRMLIACLILSLFTLNIQAQSITGISSAGAVSTGSGSAYNLKWTTSTTTTNIAKQIDLTLASITGGTKLIFDATNSTDWEVLIGSAGSNSWQSFCQVKSLSASQTAETIYVRNTSTSTGTYTNTITIGFGSSCTSFTTAVTFNVTVEKTASGVYTWVGTSGVDSTYGRSDNWSPVRTTPATSDILVVDLGTAATPVKTTINISGVTETIKQFKIFDYNTVDFVCSTSNSKWTVGNSGASGLGADFIINANSAMRKTGNSILEVVIPASDSIAALGELHTIAGELKFTGAGKHILSNKINTFGGTLSFIPSSLNTLYLDGVTQTISGTSGVLYIDSMMNVQVGKASTSTALTLNRTLPLYSTLKLLANTTLNSNTPSGSSAANWNSWVPYLQFKAATKAGAKSRGELDVLPSTASITGGGLFEIQGTNVRAYRMFGIPLKKGVNLSQFTDNIDITGSYTGNNKDSFSTTCSNCISSSFAWYESSQSWVAFSSGNNANVVPHGTGIMMFFRGAKAYNLGNPFTDANASIIDFKGELYSGDYTVNLDYNSSGTDPALRGYNLISNPYPCAIDFKEITKASGFKQKFQVYDGRAKTYNVWDSTAGLSKSGSTKFVNGGANNSRIIEAGAAFFVVASSTGQSLTFTESSKRPGLKSTIDHFKASSNSLKCNEMRVGIRFDNDSVPENDNTLIQTDMNYTGIVNEKDEFDAPKLFGGFLGIGALTPDNVWMSIDRRPASELKTYTIPLKVKTPEDNKYKISYAGCENSGGRYEVSLVDKLLNKVIPLRNGSEYLFSKSSVDALTENRFELLFNSLIEVTTGLNSAMKSKFTVYPNPSIAGEVNLVSYAGNQIQNVEIYSMDGKLVKSYNMNTNNKNVDLQKINFEGHGTYLVKMIGNQSVGTEIVIFK